MFIWLFILAILVTATGMTLLLLNPQINPQVNKPVSQARFGLDTATPLIEFIPESLLSGDGVIPMWTNEGSLTTSADFRDSTYATYTLVPCPNPDYLAVTTNFDDYNTSYYNGVVAPTYLDRGIVFDTLGAGVQEVPAFSAFTQIIMFKPGNVDKVRLSTRTNFNYEVCDNVWYWNVINVAGLTHVTVDFDCTGPSSLITDYKFN